MNALALELTRLIGNKELTFPHLLCIPCDQSPATETDFKRWMNEKGIRWEMDEDFIYIKRYEAETHILKAQEYNTPIPYDSSKKLRDQDEKTLKQIVELIKSNQ